MKFITSKLSTFCITSHQTVKLLLLLTIIYYFIITKTNPITTLNVPPDWSC